MIKFADVSIPKSAINKAEYVLESGNFINGEYNQRFESEWAFYCGTDYAIGTSNGSGALIACLKYLMMKSNKRFVVVPTYSFAATVFAVVEAGCVPIYCPVDDMGLIRFDKIEDRDDILAIVPVHLYGQFLDIPEMDIPIIEDACQAHGIAHLSGLAACYSFYPAKNLGCAGDGGAVVTNDKEMADWVRAYINYGDFKHEKFVHSIVGNNLRLDNLQAAILVEKLKRLCANNEKRVELAKRYIHNGVPCLSKVSENVFHLYPILAANRKAFRWVLDNEGIPTGNHYPYTLDTLYSSCKFEGEDKAQKIASNVVTLPMGPHLETKDIDKICEVITNDFKLEGGYWT